MYLKRFVRSLSREMKANVRAVGVGNTRKLRFLSDERMPLKEFVKNERRCLEIYADSHVCIGVQGSNLLFPAYLEDARISQLPEFKVLNYSEDLLPRQEPTQKALYFLRVLPVSTSPKILVSHVANMVTGWKHGLKG